MNAILSRIRLEINERVYRGVCCHSMGVFAIYRDNQSDSTVIPNLFIDEYMKDANDAELKVYLYLIRMMSAGQPTSISEIADRFNHTEREVVRSLRYWEKKGLLVLQLDENGNLAGIRLREPRPIPADQNDHQVISITPILSARENARAAREQASAVLTSRPDSNAMRADPAADSDGSSPYSAELSGGHDTITAAQLTGFQKAESNRQLILIVEGYIGKPLSVSEMKTIYFISEQLHFSNELIDYLVDYCVGRGKKDFRYIEKVACNWAEEGISTPAAARKSVQKGLSGKRKGASSKKAPKGAGDFNRFQQNSYNFEELEKQLLQQ